MSDEYPKFGVSGCTCKVGNPEYDIPTIVHYRCPHHARMWTEVTSLKNKLESVAQGAARLWTVYKALPHVNGTAAQLLLEQLDSVQRALDAARQDIEGGTEAPWNAPIEK